MRKLVINLIALISLLCPLSMSGQSDGCYLLVYHKDNTHSIHMAISKDGYTFHALNKDKPVINGDTIAEQRGVRDPHIFRGPDGTFYLAMTDLHIYAQREGKRATEWERDGKTYGWGNNKNLVLMKSRDLIHWQHALLRMDKIDSEIGCAWAPETAYDDKTGQLMVYFTMRHQNGQNKLYYAYVNERYDSLTTTPKILFEHPKEGVSAIDGDIVKVGNRYYLSYVSHEETPGIKQAYSDNITGPWTYQEAFVDPEPTACEAPNVWKRIGEEKWVLMYDCYGQKTHNFGFVETTDFKTFTPLGQFNAKKKGQKEATMKTENFTSPKHGAVVQLSEAEARRLCDYWGEAY